MLAASKLVQLGEFHCPVSHPSHNQTLECMKEKLGMQWREEGWDDGWVGLDRILSKRIIVSVDGWRLGVMPYWNLRRNYVRAKPPIDFMKILRHCSVRYT